MLLNLPIKSEKQTVIRPIIHGVTRDLAKTLNIGLPFNKVPIIYLDEESTRKELGTSINGDGKEGIYTKGTEFIRIQVSEELDHNTLLSYQMMENEFPPIFVHEPTDTHLITYYAHSKLKMGITYRAHSKAQARAWLNNIQSKIRMYQSSFTHNLDYYYLLDDVALYCLSEVWRLSKEENKKPLTDWLKSNFTSRFCRVTDMAGNNEAYAISEKQVDVLGTFDFDGMMEEGDKVDGVQTWDITFDYVLHYMRPIEVSIWYPNVVYNQVVPDVMIGTDKATGEVEQETEATMHYPDNKRYYSTSQYAMHLYSSAHEKEKWAKYKGVGIPYWDEFLPEQMFSLLGTQRLVDQLVLLDEKDGPGTLLMDLNNPGSFTLDKCLLDFILSEKQYVLNDYASVVQIFLYRNGKSMKREALKIEDGKIYLNHSIDLKYIYRIRIMLMYDWELIHPNALERLYRYSHNTCDLVSKLKEYISHGEYAPEQYRNWGHGNMGRASDSPWSPYDVTHPFFTQQTAWTENCRLSDVDKQKDDSPIITA